MSDAAFDIAAGGMVTQRVAMDAIAREIAGPGAIASSSSNTTSDFMPASFSGALDDALSLAGASGDPAPLGAGEFAMFETDDEPTLAQIAAQPETDRPSPTGGAGGDTIGAMISLISAGRAYDADVAALQAAKQMDIEASDIDKF